MEELPHGTETVLIVDDDAPVRTPFRALLTKLGYEVLEAADAFEAMMVCERNPEPIHLMITDVIMPKMSGPELANRVAITRPDMKVIFISGYTDQAATYEGVVGDGAVFLNKPFELETLATKVREVLDGGPA